jgi:hypothetical protein
MRRLRHSKILALDANHPGLVRRVDEMFDSFATVRQVHATVRRDFGVHVCYETVWRYRKFHWSVKRDRALTAEAAMMARQELEAEERT